jgi:TonB family protein
MRTILPRRASRFAALFFLFVVPWTGAQTALKPSVAIPSDPRALLELATRLNSLSGDDIKPWRIEASFGEMGTDEQVTRKGTFEEVWAGPTKFKRVLTTSEYTIVEYGTSNGVLRVGGAGRDDWALIALHNAFAGPLSLASDLDKMEIKAESSRIGSDTVRCVSLKPKSTAFTAPLFATSSYCFDPDTLFLRFGRDDHGTTFAGAHPVTLQDRLIPGDLAIRRATTDPALSAHIESLDILSDVSDILFTPPHAAEPAAATDQINLPANAAEGNLTTRVQPLYPPIAKAARIQGTVVLQVLIGKDGKVKEIGVQSGPPLLQQAAIDAVKQWIYKPYLVNGKPKSVYTPVNVIFILEK